MNVLFYCKLFVKVLHPIRRRRLLIFLSDEKVRLFHRNLAFSPFSLSVGCIIELSFFSFSTLQLFDKRESKEKPGGGAGGGYYPMKRQGCSWEFLEIIPKRYQNLIFVGVASKSFSPLRATNCEIIN